MLLLGRTLPSIQKGTVKKFHQKPCLVLTYRTVAREVCSYLRSHAGLDSCFHQELLFCEPQTEPQSNHRGVMVFLSRSLTVVFMAASVTCIHLAVGGGEEISALSD